MEPLTLRGLTIGHGRPKIAVPLTAPRLPLLLCEAEALRGTPAQLAEWRVDCFAPGDSPAALLEAAPQLRAALGEMPLLATYRRSAEGGHGALNLGGYAAVIEALALTGTVDLMDLELSAGEAFIRRESAFCRAHGVKVLLSSHDFGGTPGLGTLLQRLNHMEALGCDVAKIAVMPHSPSDVLTLLDATQTFAARAQVPIVTMSMGALGSISRVSGQVFGSAITFAAVGSASAPGQLTAEETAQIMDALYAV